MKRGLFLAGGCAAASISATRPALAVFGDERVTGTLTIAVAVPLSGPQIRPGERIADGVRAALDDANHLSGPLDRTFAMRTFNDENLLAEALQNARFAIDDLSIIAVVGHLGGQVTSQVVPVYAAARLPLVVPASTYDRITMQGAPNVFRLPTKDATEGALFARYLRGNVKPKSVVTLVQDGDYGPGVADGFARAASTEKLPVNTVVFAVENPNYPAAAKSALSFAPDFIFLAGEVKDMGPVIPALRSGGYSGALGASEGFFNEATIKDYGGAVDSMLVSSSMPPLQRAPGAYRLMNDFQARYGEITSFSAFGYASAQILISAARRSGASDRFSLLRSLNNGGSYDTIVGAFTFASSGDPVDPNLYFYSVRDSKFHFERPSHPTSLIL
ncbi:MAG: branched-chain amino acid ABC transporter substrate-binding protein [Candidatus Eremiobacteraeota bacterium]|nr:branched-chain amino acid ABC transporter substrate-binding protein [Candidatus Eremiobacteraeota bacterium]